MPEESSPTGAWHSSGSDPVRSKHSTLLFPRKLQSCHHGVFTLNSTSLCSKLLIHVRACSGGEKRHGVEAVLGVYHGFGGPGAPPASRVLGDGKPHPAPTDQGACTTERRGTHDLGRDWQEAG